MAKEEFRERQTRRSRFVVAVAQTPGGLTEAFLRVGSKKPQVVARLRRALLGLGAASRLSDRHSERGPGFRKRLCATATVRSERRGPLRADAPFPRIPRLSAPAPGCPCDNGCRARAFSLPIGHVLLRHAWSRGAEFAAAVARKEEPPLIRRRGRSLRSGGGRAPPPCGTVEGRG
jgi:hypothetical protein